MHDKIKRFCRRLRKEWLKNWCLSKTLLHMKGLIKSTFGPNKLSSVQSNGTFWNGCLVLSCSNTGFVEHSLGDWRIIFQTPSYITAKQKGSVQPGRAPSTLRLPQLSAFPLKKPAYRIFVRVGFPRQASTSWKSEKNDNETGLLEHSRGEFVCG